MTERILFRKSGRLGLATLDRPQALNALDRAMCATLHRQLMEWILDDEVEAVVLEGNGRAFCAGGDIIEMHRIGRTTPSLWRQFFHDEYRLNQAIAHYPKPCVALVDGIVMGGGVGISVHAPYRVVTENTLFAMPEAGIGMIPDVGSSHALPRFPGEFGTFVALTGARVTGADCVALGYGTHYVPAAELETLKERLAHSHEAVADVLDTFDTFDAGDEALTLPALRDGIDYLFAQDQVEDILSLLDDGDGWAREQARTMRQHSPTALKLALHALREGDGATIEQALRLEYRMVSALRLSHDFYEGVRAHLVDKDRAPRWKPARLGDVDIAPYLREPEWGDLGFD